MADPRWGDYIGNALSDIVENRFKKEFSDKVARKIDALIGAEAEKFVMLTLVEETPSMLIFKVEVCIDTEKEA